MSQKDWINFGFVNGLCCKLLAEIISKIYESKTISKKQIYFTYEGHKNRSFDKKNSFS